MFGNLRKEVYVSIPPKESVSKMVAFPMGYVCGRQSLRNESHVYFCRKSFLFTVLFLYPFKFPEA